MNINVREYLGDKINIEDAIVLRDIIKSNLNNGVTLDFTGLENIPSTFLNVLLSDLILESGRDAIFNRIDVKNLSNSNNYLRVVMGTAFMN